MDIQQDNNAKNADSTWLMSGSADGSDIKIVEPVGDRELNVAVNVSPDNQIVALYRKATGTDGQEVVPIGRNQEQFQSFNVDGLKFTGRQSSCRSKCINSSKYRFTKRYSRFSINRRSYCMFI
jgi:hypothetical protein